MTRIGSATAWPAPRASSSTPPGRWLLDTGTIELGPTLPDGPKLVCVDLGSDQIAQTIRVPREVALKTTSLNDVRFDLRGGERAMAFITDSGTKGRGHN